MKIEPLKNFEQNRLTSESFRYSFENKAMVCDYVRNSFTTVGYMPFFITVSDVVVCSITLFSLITILCSGMMIMLSKKEKNDGKCFSKRYRIIQFIFASLLFVVSLPFTIRRIPFAKSFDWFKIKQIFILIDGLSKMPFAIVLINFIICVIAKASLKEHEDEKLIIKKRIKINIILLVIFFILACIPTFLKWTLHAI